MNWTATDHRVKSITRREVFRQHTHISFLSLEGSLKKNIYFFHQTEFTWLKTEVRQDSDL